MISKKKVYFDSCILISFVHEKHPNHNRVSKALKIIESFETFEAYVSHWALNEMKKVLVKDYHYSAARATEIFEKIMKTSALGNLKLNWVDMHADKEYSFKEFFEHLTSLQVISKEIHLADAIHSVIMINNEIDHLFTTNGKDFMGLKTFIVLEPSQILAFEK